MVANTASVHSTQQRPAPLPGPTIGSGSTKTIRDELQKLDLPESIRAIANDIHAQLVPDTGTRRCGVRKNLIFFCIYNAYLMAGEIRDPFEIARLVDIPASAIPHALKQFSYPHTSFRMPQITTHPWDLIEQYARQQSIREDLLPSIKELCVRLTSAPEFKKFMPQPVAAGVLRYYMELNGLPLALEQFLKTYNLTHLALEKAYEAIVRYDNQ